LLALAAAALLCFLGHEALHSTFVLYTDYRYGWSERQVGLALATVGIGSTIVSAALIRPAVSRFGETRVILTGLGFGMLGFAAYASAPSGALFMLGTPVLVLWGLAGPAIQSSMTRHVSPSEQGQLQGAFSSLRGIAGLLGPVAFTQTFAFGVGGSNAAGAPYFLAAVLLGVAALILIWSALLAGRPAPGAYRAKAEIG
jgi:DHA1 family tetracycline resistance protein-like MFS transporter